MQQAEGEGDDPRKPLGKTWSSLLAMNDFRCHEKDAQLERATACALAKR
jgi:hypothetical protein